jgi:hypothetical protein
MTDEARHVAPHNAPQQPKSWRETYEVSLKSFTEQKLVLMLAEVQGRLGTSQELDGDVDRCSAIGHRLNNLHTGKKLGSSPGNRNSKGQIE